MAGYAEMSLVRGMHFLSESQSAIANNLANANTVGFRAEVEIHLNRAGPVHHVEAARADGRHVAGHDLVAALGHDGRLRQGPDRAHAKAQKADVMGRGDLFHLLEMQIKLRRRLVDGFERGAGEFELSARLQ